MSGSKILQLIFINFLLFFKIYFIIFCDSPLDNVPCEIFLKISLQLTIIKTDYD